MLPIGGGRFAGSTMKASPLTNSVSTPWIMRTLFFNRLRMIPRGRVGCGRERGVNVRIFRIFWIFGGGNKVGGKICFANKIKITFSPSLRVALELIAVFPNPPRGLRALRKTETGRGVVWSHVFSTIFPTSDR